MSMLESKAPTMAPTIFVDSNDGNGADTDDGAILPLDDDGTPTTVIPPVVDTDDANLSSPTAAPITTVISPTDAPTFLGNTDPNESTVPDAPFSPSTRSADNSGGVAMAWIVVAVLGSAAAVMGALWIARRRHRTAAAAAACGGGGGSSESGSSLTSNSRLVEV